MICIGFYLRDLVSFKFSIFDNGSTNAIAARAYLPIEPSRSEPAVGKKHWCIVAPKYLPKNTRKHFNHFPHASEILLPCWSWFMEQGATDNCGYFFHPQFELSSWPRDLIKSMGCEIQFAKDVADITPDGLVTTLSPHDIQFIPNLYLLRPRLEYIRYLNDASHAHALRRKIVSDEHILSKKGPGKNLQIGMIQRDSSRRIGNFDEIKEAIKSAIPSVDIFTTDFKFDSMKEQAEWFATKDVVVAAHGAALTNSIFITQGTIVMQLYPPGYFWQSLDPLIEQSGGRAIQWYEKGKNPAVVSATLTREEFDLAGKATFSPPVDEVVKPILYTLGIERPTNQLMKKLYGDFV